MGDLLTDIGKLQGPPTRPPALSLSARLGPIPSRNPPADRAKSPEVASGNPLSSKLVSAGSGLAAALAAAAGNMSPEVRKRPNEGTLHSKLFFSVVLT